MGALRLTAVAVYLRNQVGNRSRVGSTLDVFRGGLVPSSFRVRSPRRRGTERRSGLPRTTTGNF